MMAAFAHTIQNSQNLERSFANLTVVLLFLVIGIAKKMKKDTLQLVLFTKRENLAETICFAFLGYLG